MNASETFSTLNFADIVKKIVNVAKENVVSKKQVQDTMQLVLSLQESNKSLEELNGKLGEEKAMLLAELEALRAGGAGTGYVPSMAAAGGGGGGSSVPTSGGYGGGAPAQPVFAAKADLFIGRATLSLKSVILGKHTINTLPLETQAGQEGALLSVVTWAPKDEDSPEVPQFSDVAAAFSALSGKRFDFCINVTAAESIPEPYTDKVVCKYYFKKKENKPLSTIEASGTNPQWDFTKRYAFPGFDKSLCDWLAAPDVLTFEVRGYKKKDEASAESAESAE